MESDIRIVRRHVYPRGTRIICLVAVSLLFSVPSATPALAVEPILNLRVENIVFSPADSVVTFEIMMNSVEDSVAGIEVWLTMAAPFTLRFHESEPLDIAGSTIEDWEFVSWNFLGSPGGVMKIVGLFDYPSKGDGLPIPPSNEPQLLCTVRAQLIDPMPDTLCDFTGSVYVNPAFTRFSTPVIDGMSELIGYDIWIEYDSTFENCVEWEGDSCVAWADTIVEEIPHSAPNFELLNYQDGQYRIMCYLCGDADGSGMVDIDDPVFLIGYIFGGGSAPEPLELGDADYSGLVDIDDVVYLITYIFAAGPDPCAVF
ncbi:MAG: hypothetical protein KJ723_12010 [candidate division Zixibacteria bacterium]|nr:hypothetical protein [candidate division Zixibacteria bacterium]